uniref:Group XIIA secretory phospholipase A2 n=1 Tax=Macrostomum lignano TaxID=282301 RepID=A0A1I8GVP9_9PLAT
MSLRFTVCSLCLSLLLTAWTLGQSQAAKDEESLGSLGATLDSLRVFNTFLGGGSGVGGASGEAEQCRFRCPDGAPSRPRPAYKPTFNGCGSREFHVDTSALPAVTECCNRHDICYGTCNAAKSDCESEFKACLSQACDSMRSRGQLPDAKDYDNCKSIAGLFYETVQGFGCEFYLDAQATACQCAGETGESRGRRQEKLRKKPSSQAEPPGGSSSFFLDFGAEHVGEEL